MLVTRLSEPRGGNTIVAPPLTFTRDAWMKLMGYMEAAGSLGTEISGFGYVSMVGDMLYVATSDDVFITKQEVTPGSADVQGSVFAHALDKALMAGRADDLRLQWHKHPGGLNQQSSIDMATIRGFGAFAMQWMVSLVVAENGPCARLDHFRPYHVGCEIPVCVIDDYNPEMIAEIEREVKRLVTVKPAKRDLRTLVVRSTP